jgi:tRNA A37 threonylcarbamoyladenosine dehydratase
LPSRKALHVLTSILFLSGLSKIRLVDFDYVTLSSLNRHATAALPDVGTPKVRYFHPSTYLLPTPSMLVETDIQVQCVARAM